MNARTPQLPRETRDTLFLLLVVACCLAPLAAHIPNWGVAMAAALLGWRAWRGWQRRRRG